MQNLPPKSLNTAALATAAIGYVRRLASPRLRRRMSKHEILRDLRTLLSDVVIVSYPKSGRTWLRNMVGQALLHHYGLGGERGWDLEHLRYIDRRLPRIRITHQWVPTRPGVPTEGEGRMRILRHKSVILLSRDPRDTVVSAYFHNTARNPVYFGTLSEYLREPHGGIASVIRYLEVWQRQWHTVHRFHLVRYEDLRDNPMAELQRLFDFIAPFVQGAVSAEVIEQAAQEAEFSRMQQREAKAGLGRKPSAQPEAQKVRRGVVGGYRDTLSKEDLAYVNDCLRQHPLDFFAYLPDAP